MSISLDTSYAQTLSSLEGDEFEKEVAALIGRSIIGFQIVPANPQGDGGLDGFSHNGTRGYCCYGPEYSAAKKPKERVNAIVTKFAADLRRLFELETAGSALVHSENKELGTILPENQRLVEINLVVNWFENHQVVGPLHSLLPGYVGASRCKYVDPRVTLRIMGPNELVGLYAVDEMAVARIQQRAFLERVQSRAKALTLADPRDFDEKMSALEALLPGKSGAIRKLGGQLKDDWRTALAFEHELDATLPTLHRSLEMARGKIMGRIASLMIASDQPWKELGQAGDVAKALLQEDFGPQYGTIVTSVAHGEVARLVGECTIDWGRKNGDSSRVA
jgi:hypothetical protein